MTPHFICFQCYKEQGLKWTKNKWKKACKNKKTWRCPSFIDGEIYSPFPPPWCEFRSKLELLKRTKKSPIQVFVREE